MAALGMPPNILALFAPRAALKHLPPLGGYGKKPVYEGMAGLVDLFETTSPPPKEKTETPKEAKERRRRQKLEEHRQRQQQLIGEYDPSAQNCATKNPFATLFVGRISFETTEKKLKKEFERYGPIRKVKIVTDMNGKSRGYAFIEYESESDLKKAYKSADGTKIDGRRVLVDAERARTVPKWLPRRLGGGKGPSRFAEAKKKTREAPTAPGQAPFAPALAPRPSMGRGGGYGHGGAPPPSRYGRPPPFASPRGGDSRPPLDHHRRPDYRFRGGEPPPATGGPYHKFEGPPPMRGPARNNGVVSRFNGSSSRRSRSPGPQHRDSGHRRRTRSRESRG